MKQSQAEEDLAERAFKIILQLVTLRLQEVLDIDSVRYKLVLGSTC
jgi:hypothetical protein